MRGLNRKWRALALITGALVVLGACGSDSTKNTTDTSTGGEVKEFSIAYVGPLTGDAANLGIYIRNGAKVAVDEFNAKNKDYKIT